MTSKTRRTAVLGVALIAFIGLATATEYTDDSFYDNRGIVNGTQTFDTDNNFTVDTQVNFNGDTETIDEGSTLYIEFYNYTSGNFVMAGTTSTPDEDPFHDWNAYCGQDPFSNTIPQVNLTVADTCGNTETGFYGDTQNWMNLKHARNNQDEMRYRFFIDDSSGDNIYSQPVTYTFDRNNTVDARFVNPTNPTSPISNWTTSVTAEVDLINPTYGDIRNSTMYISHYNRSSFWTSPSSDKFTPFYNWTGDLSSVSDTSCVSDNSDGTEEPNLQLGYLCDNQRVGFQGSTGQWSFVHGNNKPLARDFDYRFQIYVEEAYSEFLEGENIFSSRRNIEFNNSHVFEDTKPAENHLFENNTGDFAWSPTWSVGNQPSWVQSSGGEVVFYDKQKQNFGFPYSDFFNTDQTGIPADGDGYYNFTTELSTYYSDPVKNGTDTFAYVVFDSSSNLVDDTDTWYSSSSYFDVGENVSTVADESVMWSMDSQDFAVKGGFWATFYLKGLVADKSYQMQYYDGTSWNTLGTFTADSGGNANPQQYLNPIGNEVEYTSEGWKYRLIEAGTGNPIANDEFIYVRHGFNFDELDTFSHGNLNNELYYNQDNSLSVNNGELTIDFPSDSVSINESVRPSEKLRIDISYASTDSATDFFGYFAPEPGLKNINQEYFDRNDICRTSDPLKHDFASGNTLTNTQFEFWFDNSGNCYVKKGDGGGSQFDKYWSANFNHTNKDMYFYLIRSGGGTIKVDEWSIGSSEVESFQSPTTVDYGVEPIEWGDNYTIPGMRDQVQYAYEGSNGYEDWSYSNSNTLFSKTLSIRKNDASRINGSYVEANVRGWWKNVEPQSGINLGNTPSDGLTNLNFTYDFHSEVTNTSIKPQVYVQTEGSSSKQWTDLGQIVDYQVGVFGAQSGCLNGNDQQVYFDSDCQSNTLEFEFNASEANFFGATDWRWMANVESSTDSTLQGDTYSTRLRRISYPNFDPANTLNFHIYEKGSAYDEYETDLTPSLSYDLSIPNTFANETVEINNLVRAKSDGDLFKINSSQVTGGYTTPDMVHGRGYDNITYSDLEGADDVDKYEPAYNLSLPETYTNGVYTPSTFWREDDFYWEKINRTDIKPVPPEFRNATLQWTPGSQKDLLIGYYDDRGVVDTSSSPPSGAVSFGDPYVNVSSISSPFDWSFTLEDAEGGFSNQTVIDTSTSYTGIAPNSTGVQNTSKQVLYAEATVSSAEEPLRAEIGDIPTPDFHQATLKSGSGTLSEFTGDTKSLRWEWEVDGVDVNEGTEQTQADSLSVNLSSQTFKVPTSLENKLDYDLSRVEYNGSTYFLSANSSLEVANETTEGDFIQEKVSNFTAEGNQFNIEENYQGVAELELNETQGVDWSNIDSSKTLGNWVSNNGYTGCSLANTTSVDVPANAQKSVVVSYDCPVGQTKDPSVGATQINDTVDRLEKNATLELYSNATDEDALVWEINQSDFDQFFDSETSIISGTAEAEVDGKQVADSNVVNTGSSFQVTVPDTFGNSSLHEGSYNATFAFQAQETTDGDDGGGGFPGGGGGEDPEEDEITVEFSNETIGATYGSLITKTYTITNKVDKTNFVTVDIPDSGACQYYEVETGLNTETFGKLATYEVPQSSSGADSGESSINPLVKITLPAEEQVETTELECEIDVSASEPKAGGFHLDANAGSSILDPIVNPIQRSLQSLFGTQPERIQQCDNVTSNLQNEECPQDSVTGSFTVSPSGIFAWIVVMMLVAGVGYRFYKETYAK